MEEQITGGCLCGGVRYRIEGPMPDVVACHCTQCRKTTGHFLASTTVPTERFHLEKEETLTWFNSSDIARRGFCSRCGANLFWDPLAEDRISVTAGTIDGKTGLKIESHIFTDTAGDYYSLPDQD